MNLQENISLASRTTIGVGGPARWFVEATSEGEVADAVTFARERSLPVFVLGGGSNLLVSDRGFDGIVLHVGLRGIERQDLPDGTALLKVAAGENWDDLVQHTVENDLAGMECLAGIPGTVGGTPVQNVGAYGQEVSETIHSLRCFDTQTSSFVELSNADCGFAYRTSLLNTSERGRYIILRVEFTLIPGGAPKLSYADLRKRFPAGGKPSLVEVAEAVREIRRGKGMVVDQADPNSRSAGSFFRNPVVSAELLPGLSQATGVATEQIPNWPTDDGSTKLPAAWLLERAGFVRGYTMGRAGISAKHTLALINLGGATASDVAALRDRITATVQERFGILLQQEPVSLGF